MKIRFDYIFFFCEKEARWKSMMAAENANFAIIEMQSATTA
jgi:hypothetical protein